MRGTTPQTTIIGECNVTTKRTQISLSAKIKSQCDQYYEETGFGISVIITMALMEFFERRLPEKKEKAEKTPEKKKHIPSFCMACTTIYHEPVEVCTKCGSHDISSMGNAV
jgi:hypothetical protein